MIGYLLITKTSLNACLFIKIFVEDKIINLEKYRKQRVQIVELQMVNKREKDLVFFVLVKIKMLIIFASLFASHIRCKWGKKKEF